MNILLIILGFYIAPVIIHWILAIILFNSVSYDVTILRAIFKAQWIPLFNILSIFVLLIKLFSLLTEISDIYYKNKMKKINFKKFFFIKTLLILIILSFTACVNKTPLKQKPFIIIDKELYGPFKGKFKAEFTYQDKNGYISYFTDYADKYSIGDTIN